MSDTSHCDLAAVLPYAEPVLVSPPLILVWRGHGSTFPLCSGLFSLSAPGGGEGGVRWGIPERGAGTHLTLPSLRDGPLPLPPEGREGQSIARSVHPLGDDPPLVDELAWGHLLERHLDGGAHWHLVGRGAREIGIEIDPLVRVQRHHCEVIGLIGHAPVEAAILDHDGGRDMASSVDLFPRQTGGRVADLAGLLRRVLQPVTGSAVLQDEPPLIDGVPEGLAQRVGDGDQLWHRFTLNSSDRAARFNADSSYAGPNRDHRAGS